MMSMSVSASGSTAMPASSHSSRAADSTGRSPCSTWPPGMNQPPAEKPPARFMTSISSPRQRTTDAESSKLIRASYASSEFRVPSSEFRVPSSEFRESVSCRPMTTPTPFEIRRLLGEGLPPATGPTSVAIIGAGMAGLTAAHELLHAGYTVTLLEAQNRVGGRVFTMREPFTEGLYGEAGAMRIPRAHDLTQHYVAKFGLPTKPFTMGNPKAWVMLHGQKVRLGEFKNDEHALPFELAEEEMKLAIGDRWVHTLQPLFERIKAGGEEAWQEIASELDQFSLWEFLEHQGWSQGAIELYCLMFHME